MKKTVFSIMFAFVAAFAFTACGFTGSADNTDSVAVDTVDSVCDSVCCDTLVPCC